MEEQFSRMKILLGDDTVRRISERRVAVFGVGGVGSFCAEALARLGIGNITLVDPDKVAESNLNRQLIALHSTVGMYKADVMKRRILDINPCANVETLKMFYLPENADKFDVSGYDCIVDAIDTVSAKIELIKSVGIVSSMGTGNKLSPELLKTADIYDTKVCPLARVMRKELRAAGVKKLTVVYSEEEPKSEKKIFDEKSGKAVVGSISFVPSTAGLLLASEVFKIISK